MTENNKSGAQESSAEKHKDEAAVLEEGIEILEEIVDLEEWAKADKTPKRAKRYRIRIDKEYEVVNVHSMTGSNILSLVGKTPQTHLLSQNFGEDASSLSRLTRSSISTGTRSSDSKLWRSIPRRADKL